MDNIYFGQYNYNNINFFKTLQYDFLKIKVEETPHYKFLQGDIEAYSKYLKQSWRDKEKRSIDQKIEEYNYLIQNVLAEGIKEPVLIALDYFNNQRIIHGNHRAAIASFYNLELPYIITDFLDVKELKNIKNYKYGLKDKVYQSVYFNDIKIINGRRWEDRFKFLIKKDIRNKTVIDIGCNIGANCISISKLAKEVIGIDNQKNIIDFAIKLSVFFNMYNLKYEIFDFSEGIYDKCVDVAFIFSVDKHINNNNNLSKYIRNYVKEIVYFETHEKSIMPIEIKSQFSKIKLIAKYSGRKFYRCIK